jgi:hypothetical protein
MIEQLDRLRHHLVVEEAVAALAVEVAGDRGEQDQRPVVLEAVAVLHRRRRREHDLRRRRGRRTVPPRARRSAASMPQISATRSGGNCAR